MIYDYQNNTQRLLQGHCNKITCTAYYRDKRDPRQEDYIGNIIITADVYPFNSSPPAQLWPRLCLPRPCPCWLLSNLLAGGVFAGLRGSLLSFHSFHTFL